MLYVVFMLWSQATSKSVAFYNSNVFTLQCKIYQQHNIERNKEDVERKNKTKHKPKQHIPFTVKKKFFCISSC